MFEQVDPGVAVLSQVGGGDVRHARCLLIVVGDHVVHVGFGVCELFKRSAFCRTTQVVSEERERVQENSRTGCRTASKWISIDDSRQETAKSTHRQVTDETAELLPDLLALEPPLRLRSDTNIWHRTREDQITGAPTNQSATSRAFNVTSILAVTFTARVSVAWQLKNYRLF